MPRVERGQGAHPRPGASSHGRPQPAPAPALRPSPLQLQWRLSDEPVGPSTDPEHADPSFRANTRTKIYLGYTSEWGSHQ
jgi:hypothetical protein